jgi:hypothetical protein
MKNVFASIFLFAMIGISNNYCFSQEIINFEETWQKFLAEPLNSGVSRLPKPEKTNVTDYLKYCLMSGNTYFCSDNIKSANELLAEVATFPKDQYKAIPGYEERYLDLIAKIKAYNDLDDIWKTFIKNRTVNMEDLEAVSKAKTVCEKGTLAKYYLLSSYANYCKGEVSNSRTDLESRVLTLVEKANFDPNKVPGMVPEIKSIKEALRINAQLDPAWEGYLKTDKSPGFVPELEVFKCYVIPNLKIYVLRAMVDVCKYGAENLKKIKDLQTFNTKTVPVELQNKIDWLEAEVNKYNGNIADLNKAWQEFLKNGSVISGVNYKGIFCEKDAQIKSYLIEGLSDPCNKGESMLEKIAEVQKNHNPSLDNITTEKIELLKNIVAKEKQGVELFSKAWGEFSTNDTIVTNTNFPFEYCDKEKVVMAYVMDGRLAPCQKGAGRLSDINKFLSNNSVTLSSTAQQKLDYFTNLVKGYDKNNSELNTHWNTFISNNDTILTSYSLDNYYCDKIMQVKSWCLMGHYNTCKQGQQYLNKIDAFQKEHNLKFDNELACRITRLRLKIWDCRYWELVEQAWKETHEERERFGPPSSQIMYKDLNGPKQVCETKVEYEPLGKIGIKYVIKIYLCKEVDLAQMGDPEYYKKIANWIDTEVLVKYCAPDMRCKKDFTIYIEGHTDGHPFGYYKYKDPLNIPKGTAFTHFLDKAEPVQKVTERELTYELKSNLELGLGRAWTVKKQLDFIGVPFTIGAYEHPLNEKGGEYRRMEVEINMPNLLLDFFEKRLNILLEASGIGPQPKNCKA